MANQATNTKLKVAKVFGIDPRRPEGQIPVIPNTEPFIEEEPTVAEWFREITPSSRAVRRYVTNLFPFLSWIGKYNLTWFTGDLIAGITVGAVVVPQSMAYTSLAKLDVEFGLYSSFMGVLIYWFFATSKDITIGPVAVMSQVTGNVVGTVLEKLPEYKDHPNVIASALAVIAGGIITFLGLARLGWLVEFIPLPAICAFMTGSAINIASGQLSKLMGIKNIKTRNAPYRVIIDTLKAFPKTDINAAMGLSALFMLYLIRGTCSYMAKKQPQRTKLYFFISTLRTAFVILLYTGISAAVNVRRKHHPMFSVVGTVPRGFRHAAVPTLNTEIISAFSSELPAAVIVMLIEHISISKSFGRINNYVIDPSQELIAIGVTNLLGPFLGAYPATGSFSRTAIKSRAGVRTPFAGVITALVVLLALYALTSVFYYIPNASLAAVIIHAVCDVITPPSTLVQFWRVAPLDVPIFFTGVLVTVFSSIENGIYATTCISFAIVIWRLFLTKGRFLGRARIRTVRTTQDSRTNSTAGDAQDLKKQPTFEKSQEKDEEENGEEEFSLRPGFLPLKHENGINQQVIVENPYPGVFMYRFAEGFNYPNATRYLNHLTEIIFQQTRRTDPSRLGKAGDRPWNDKSPRNADEILDDKPTLKAIVLDMSTVNNIDATSVQALMDVRSQLDKYTAPDTVDWHFAHIENRWAKRGLAAAGFGYRDSPHQPDARGEGHTIFSIAELGGSDSAAAAAAASEAQKTQKASYGVDIESDPGSDKLMKFTTGKGRQLLVQGLNRPLFHLDLQEALEAAITDAKQKRT